MSPKPDLSNITLCAIDCLNPTLAGRALGISMDACAFGDAILFSDTSIEGAFRYVAIEPIHSVDAYSTFVLQKLHGHITTPYLLIVQWDGYVVDPAAWDPSFLEYDYIGAKWPWHQEHTVGNGGFSLRSRRLLQVMTHMPCMEGLNEDDAICRFWRPDLEKTHGVRFAPEVVADRFAYEWTVPDRSTFGFHGMFNLWRHAYDDDIVRIAQTLDARSVLSRDYVKCTVMLAAQRRFKPLAALYGRWRATLTPEEIEVLVKQYVNDEAMVDACLRIAEATLEPRPL